MICFLAEMEMLSLFMKMERYSCFWVGFFCVVNECEALNLLAF